MKSRDRFSVQCTTAIHLQLHCCVCRVKQYHSRSAQYEQILKKNEQMYALTAVTLALCPAAQRELDETVVNTLKEKCVHRPLSLAFSSDLHAKKAQQPL